jgi:hypothetical protein
MEAARRSVMPGARMIDSSVLPPVIPAKAGIHNFLCCNEDKSWIPAFAGMTGGTAGGPMFTAAGISRPLGGRIWDPLNQRSER